MKRTPEINELIARMEAEGRIIDHGAKRPTPEPEAGISEEAFQQAVIDLAKSRLWRVYHTRDSRKSAKGFPDLVMVRGGRIIVAELKRSEKEQPTADQATWLEEFGKTAAETFLWRPADWPEIEEALK